MMATPTTGWPIIVKLAKKGVSLPAVTSVRGSAARTEEAGRGTDDEACNPGPNDDPDAGAAAAALGGRGRLRRDCVCMDIGDRMFQNLVSVILEGTPALLGIHELHTE
jgi:hypothetical protein